MSGADRFMFYALLLVFGLVLLGLVVAFVVG